MWKCLLIRSEYTRKVERSKDEQPLRLLYKWRVAIIDERNGVIGSIRHFFYIENTIAKVAELVDALDSKSSPAHTG
ncbi:MAG: hypothetical protein HW407_1909 [Bacteroidetes bacterium]|nr:hypothetical protein [Bacteroidota bacterium]